jgi:hypothetical protein
MDLRIRPAQLDDAVFMVPLVNDADGGMPLHIWKSLAFPGADHWDVGIRRIQSDDTPVSWRMGWTVENAGTPVGLAILHQLSETPEQLEATIMSPLWVPIVELEVLAADSGYIKTLSVSKAMRGAGRRRGPSGSCSGSPEAPRRSSLEQLRDRREAGVRCSGRLGFRPGSKARPRGRSGTC